MRFTLGGYGQYGQEKKPNGEPATRAHGFAPLHDLAFWFESSLALWFVPDVFPPLNRRVDHFLDEAGVFERVLHAAPRLTTILHVVVKLQKLVAECLFVVNDDALLPREF